MKSQQQKEIKKKQQSDSSRHVGLVGGKKEGDNATVFTFCKNLLRNVSIYAQRGLITFDEWKKIHTQILLDVVHKYSLEQQKELQDIVSKAQGEIKDGRQGGNDGGQHHVQNGSGDGGSDRNSIINYFEGAHKQNVINEAQLTFLRSFIMITSKAGDKEASNNGDDDSSDVAMDEMKAVQAMYGPEDFKYEAAEFEERAIELSHKCTITCRPSSRSRAGGDGSDNDKDAPWLQVLFQFGITYPSTAARVTFVESHKCTVAELVVLESLLEREAMVHASKNKVAVVPLVSYTARYLDTVAGTKVTKDAKPGELPYIPKNYKLTDLHQQTKNMEFVNMSLEELDKVLCIAVHDAVMKFNQQTKTEHQITHIENVISPATFNLFKAKLVEFNTKHPTGLPYAPIITFHGTCTPARIACISKHGLISAGEYTPDGFYIHVAHGALLGCGIYSTPDFRLANCYAYGDHVGNSQLFASLTLLGTPYLVKDFDDIFSNYVYNSLCPVNGHDSHIWRVAHSEQYVVFDAAQILPVLLVTVSPPGVKTLEDRLKVKLDMSGPPILKAQNEMAKWKKMAQAQDDQATNKQKRKGDPELVMFRVPGTKMHWALSLTKEDLEEVTTQMLWWDSDRNDAAHFANMRAPEIRLTLLLDKSSSMGSTFANVALPACGQLYQSLSPTACTLVLFGRSIDVHPSNKITSARFFELPEIRNTRLEDATDIIGGFKKAVDIAMRDDEEIIRESESQSFEEKKSELDEQKLKEAEKQRKKEHKQSPDKEDAVELGLTLKEEKALRRKFGREPPTTNIIHIFVLISDGEDTINTDEGIETALRDTYNMFKGSGKQSIFKVIGIGRNSDTHLAMRLKLAAQTVKMWESTPVHYVRRAASLPVVMQALSDELKVTLSDRNNSLQLTNLGHVIGEGFIVNLTNPPVKDISIRLHPTRRTCILFKGVPPRSVMFEHGPLAVYLQEHPPLDEIGVQASILSLLSSLVSDIKVAIVAGRDVSTVVAEVRGMVEGVKTANFDEHHLRGTSPAQRVQIMKNKRRLVVELEEILNTLEDTINLGKSKMSSDQQAVWLNQVANMKYGAQALRRAAKTHVDCALVIKNLKDIRQQVDAGKLTELPSDPKSPISGLTAVGHLREITEPFPSNIVQLLYSYGITGIGIQVSRSEASNVDPWKISVTYLSSDWWDTTSAMCSLHATATHRDSMGRVAQDVLVILDPKNPAPYQAFLKSPLHAAYLGVIYSRNPDIQLPAQQSGLLMSALVRGVTQLLEPAFRTRGFMATLFKLVFTIRARIMKKGESSEYWEAVLKKLTLSQPGKWMTEAPEDDIGSVAKLLGVLCSSVEKVKALQLFGNTQPSKQQLAEVSLALLAETSSRGARVKIKSIIEKLRLKDLTAKPPQESKITHELLFDVLGLQENCVHPDARLEVFDEPITKHSDQWNLERAKKKSGTFFYNQVTTGSNNCPPQAVLACLTFAEAVATPQFENLEDTLSNGSEETLNSLYDSVLKAFEGVSMRTFIQRYICFEGSSNLAGSTAVDLQVALFVQGAKYHNSQTRRQGLPSLVQAREVVGGIARDERAVQYEAELKGKFAEVRKLNTKAALHAVLAAKKFRQAVFMEAHIGLPKIFSFNEVHVLNLSRPPDDQLERTEGGLLMHHCCFPSCPLYLHNLATDKDRILGRRHGLYKHMKLFRHPANYYVPHLHLVASAIVRRDSQIAFDVFQQKVEHDTDWSRTDYDPATKRHVISQLYHTLIAFYKQEY